MSAVGPQEGVCYIRSVRGRRKGFLGMNTTVLGPKSEEKSTDVKNSFINRGNSFCESTEGCKLLVLSREGSIVSSPMSVIRGSRLGSSSLEGLKLKVIDHIYKSYSQ